MNHIKNAIITVGLLIALSACATNGQSNTQLYGEITGGIEHTHVK